MLKRKQFEMCLNHSGFQNPENLLNNFFPNLKKQRKSCTTAENPNFGSGIEFQLLNVELNGAPFYDFFAKEDKGNPKSFEKIKVNENQLSDNAEAEVPLEITPLNMYNPNTGQLLNPPFDSNKWTIRKTLTVSDCAAQHRLLIGRKQAEDQILCHLNESSRAEVTSLDGCRVKVYDCDVGIEKKLTLKKWPSTMYYGLMDSWKRDFVDRRGLVPSDEIGLCWDNVFDRFLFSVLKTKRV